jgi:hypothetical protein
MGLRIATVLAVGLMGSTVLAQQAPSQVMTADGQTTLMSTRSNRPRSTGDP